ncbi:MAG: helix-hairpin-helix domain-containing protein [Acidimicrobiales bacterium]
MAPSPNDPSVDPDGGARPADRVADPLAELRRAVVEPAAPWPIRIADAVERLRGRPAGRAVGRPDRVALLAAIAIVAVLVVGGLLLWRGGVALPGSGSTPDVAASLPRAGTGTTAAAGGSRGTSATGDGAAGPDGATTTTGGGLIVQVAGAVVRPGVYHLAAGSRVGDLIDQAGGFTADADADRVNLASPLADGVRIWVPRRGEADPPTPVGGGGGAGGAAGSGSSGTGGGPPALVDLNTATADELDALPGVGPATAAAIIDYRQRNGPFHTVDELAEVRGIGDAKLAQLRDLVRV